MRGMRERMHSIRLLLLFANHSSPSSISESLFSFTSISSGYSSRLLLLFACPLLVDVVAEVLARVAAAEQLLQEPFDAHWARRGRRGRRGGGTGRGGERRHGRKIK